MNIFPLIGNFVIKSNLTALDVKSTQVRKQKEFFLSHQAFEVLLVYAICDLISLIISSTKILFKLLLNLISSFAI